MCKKFRRLSRKIITADWKEVDIYKNDITNIITDAMINNSIIKINYKDSGWRNCLPYGWYITKDNNVIMYVYKEDLSIRSYRLDRILGLFIDDKLDTEINKQDLDENEIQEKIEELEIMELPENNDDIIEISENEEGAETPFDESLDILQGDFDVPEGYESDWRTLNKMMEQQPIEQDIEDTQDEDTSIEDENIDILNNMIQEVAKFKHLREVL